MKDRFVNPPYWTEVFFEHSYTVKLNTQLTLN